MAAPHPDCRCTELATGAAGKVFTCDACGTVHVALPQVALRLERSAFRDLVYLLARAQLAIEDDTPDAVPAPARVSALH